MKRLLAVLAGRARAYKLVFRPEQPAVQVVLQDLAVFCRANETCFHADARVHAVAEGRREVWLRIQQHLNLTAEELASLYTKPPTYRPPTTEGDDHDD